mgnify:CR=1 FL=1|tara:strand:- start:2833 stop:3024 length:192 start_codon:yes stop_codon:yes gene_type:complete
MYKNIKKVAKVFKITRQINKCKHKNNKNVKNKDWSNCKSERVVKKNWGELKIRSKIQYIPKYE